MCSRFTFDDQPQQCIYLFYIFRIIRCVCQKGERIALVFNNVLKRLISDSIRFFKCSLARRSIIKTLFNSCLYKVEPYQIITVVTGAITASRTINVHICLSDKRIFIFFYLLRIVCSAFLAKRISK